MRKLVPTLFLVLIMLSGTVCAANVVKVEREFGPSFVGYAPDKCIVIVREGTLPIRATSQAGIAITGNRGLDEVARRFQVNRFFRQFPGAEKASKTHPVDRTLTRYYKAKFPEGNLEAVMDAYSRVPFVERVEPVGIHAMYATPNDFYYYLQWHLNQASDHDIDAPEAWDIEAGADATVVAILDSGTRYYHPDLGGVNASPSDPGVARGNMWINNAELNGLSGVDDDGNEYVDDWIGYDFIDGVSNCWSGEDCNTKDNDPRDFNGHGTHTSGIFGMITNDGYGMCGVAGGWGNRTQTEYGNGVKIMALRMGYSYNFLGQELGVVMMDAAAEAFIYAADNGARIASCSWGSSNSGGIGAAATYFLNSGGIICVAAGNDGAEVSPNYLNGRGDCISVAATDESDDGASFTTYGTWVDICAPGVDIYSTYHVHSDPDTNYWAAMGGTSMATPMVAGVVALIWSQNPTWTASQVEDQLYSSADNIDAYLSPKYIGKMGAGRINAYGAVSGGCDLVADFTADLPTGCAPLTVDFTDLSTGTGVDGWDWDFGDGGSSTVQNPTYTYNTPGTYTVTLTVSSSSQSCSDNETKVDFITVDGPPMADFSGNPTTGEAPLTVEFTDLSSGNPDNWLWNFGDGGASFEQNPVYTYTTQGKYTVTLTAGNPCGSDVATEIDYITVTEPGQTTKARAQSDIPILGTVTGSYLSTFASDDSYEVITEERSADHPRKTTSRAEHKWDFDLGSGGSNMMFYVEGYRTDNAEGDDFIFEYSTDDVTYNHLVTVASVTEQVYSTSLPAGLTGTVYVKVRDSNRSWGLVSLDAVYIDNIYIEYETIPGPPMADFVGSPTSGEYPLTVDFTDLSTGNPDTWGWTFGDGGTSAVQNPSYTYTTADKYTVTLIASNSHGLDTETRVEYITVTGLNSSHVHDMVVGRKKVGANNKGTCTVTIYDQTNAPLPNATVYVNYDGPNNGSLSGVTGDDDGTVYFESAPYKKPPVDWCFEVTDVTHATYTYNSAANNVTRACERGWVYGSGPSDYIALKNAVPDHFALLQNYPNPFNPATRVAFSLPEPSQVRLEVFNISGQTMLLK